MQVPFLGDPASRLALSRRHQGLPLYQQERYFESEGAFARCRWGDVARRENRLSQFGAVISKRQHAGQQNQADCARHQRLVKIAFCFFLFLTGLFASCTCLSLCLFMIAATSDTCA